MLYIKKKVIILRYGRLTQVNRWSMDNNMGYEPITYCPTCGEPNDVYMPPEHRFCSEECEAKNRERRRWLNTSAWSNLTVVERAPYIERARTSTDQTEAHLLPKAREIYFWGRHEQDQLIGKVDLSK